ncbi:YHYH domain-containing protein [Tenacibaculum sp. 190130A14a]|uniref:YHYH domain-containing protein n=1 Tax=Tenacibaculum polynesiense TaxID=3137857 RepID=A0ABP1F109_9FLAO
MKNLKITALLIGLMTIVYSCGSNDSEGTNEGTIDEKVYDITPILSKFDGIDAITYSVSGNTLTIQTTNLPNHKSPYWGVGHAMYEAYNGTNPAWNQNPGSIGEQNITFRIPLNPSEADTKSTTPMGPIGVSRNGVVFFNQYAAGGAPLAGEINSFDQYLGHPANTQYHYHIKPKFLTDSFGEDAFLGLLSDGFPVYGPLENGKTITNDDLDDYHGHVSPTADFPDGIYHYHITNEDPYLNGSGFFGTPGSVTR